ncbi:MAG TPA: ChaN family lipoprotein [Planctomycetota bacterium]|nr:ChaN family lipoprotein [Planctomycetota bacterium]HRR79440.1 ChaN family lipoprotein [Planctomycetota bacterium]HRT95485.1 ChaN family lipoprotein [Planctomycetota bacterium]
MTRSLSVPRELAMFSGDDGLALAWDDLLEAVRRADVVVVGETHTVEAGHAVELALVQDALARWPGSAVSMEMLTRDHQATVDGYLAGKVTEEEFIKQAGIADWAGKGTWRKWFQPIVDAARAAKARVVAANTPRRHAELARREGYEALRRLPEAERGFFGIPAWTVGGSYWRRFRAEMRRHAAPVPPKPDAQKPPESPKPPEPPAQPPEPPPRPAEEKKPAERKPLDALAMFRAQELWDATMAASVLRAAKDGKGKVIHLVGAFHSDFGGGLVQRLRRGDPGLTILTISLVPAHSRRLRRADRGRADVVIYTGGQ